MYLINLKGMNDALTTNWVRYSPWEIETPMKNYIQPNNHPSIIMSYGHSFFVNI